MGYRSDVAYTIRFKDVGAMTVFIAEAQGKGLQPALDECTVNHRKLQINFLAEDVKWYDSFPIVQMHNSLVELAEDWCEGDRHRHTRETGDTGGPVEYKLGVIVAHVGEETDDNGERADGDYDWDWLRVQRRVAPDWEI